MARLAGNVQGVVVQMAMLVRSGAPGGRTLPMIGNFT